MKDVVAPNLSGRSTIVAVDDGPILPPEVVAC
jgi:hypothetical protein